ncbi:MAG TPA: methyltransferase domain-containing protein [Nannocystaceae bacterium]|nr:methyltransferase domain-containing protein [Nannocystaceae bacterium]
MTAENEMTRRLLHDAGIREGHRVLDVGCGLGSVTAIAAALVGHDGAVVGLDRDPQILERARERMWSLDLDNVDFVAADLDDLPRDCGSFDFIIGRRVLMYQRDPVAAIRALLAVLRPAGVIVFQEHDTTMIPASIVPLPLHETVHHWIWNTVAREGADLHMGFRLASVLERAGLFVEHVRAEAIVQRAATRSDLAQVIRYIAPRIVAQGVATEAELDVDTLDARLAAELATTQATFIGDMVFGAWARRID